MCVWYTIYTPATSLRALIVSKEHGEQTNEYCVMLRSHNTPVRIRVSIRYNNVYSFFVHRHAPTMCTGCVYVCVIVKDSVWYVLWLVVAHMFFSAMFGYADYK